MQNECTERDENKMGYGRSLRICVWCGARLSMSFLMITLLSFFLQMTPQNWKKNAVSSLTNIIARAFIEMCLSA